MGITINYNVNNIIYEHHNSQRTPAKQHDFVYVKFIFSVDSAPRHIIIIYMVFDVIVKTESANRYLLI